MRENPFFNQGPRARLFLTMILYRGADIGEKDNIPAGLKNGIFYFPLEVSMEPVCRSCGLLTGERVCEGVLSLGYGQKI